MSLNWNILKQTGVQVFVTVSQLWLVESRYFEIQNKKDFKHDELCAELFNT